MPPSVKMDVVSIFETLKENEEHFDDFFTKPVRFRRFLHSEFVLISEIIGEKWLPKDEKFFVLVDATEKPTTTKTPVKQMRRMCEEMTVEKTLTKKQSFASSTFSTPKPGVVDGSPLCVKFMEMSTIYAEKRNVKMIRLLSSSSQMEINLVPMSAAVARGIIGQYNVQMKKSNYDKLTKRSSIWIVCDGGHPENIFLVGGYMEKLASNRFLMDNLIISCLAVADQKDLPSLASLINRLETKFYHSTVFSRCNVLVSENSFADDETFRSSDSSTNGYLFITAEWKNVSNLMEKPQKDAKIMISMMPGLFDSRSPLATSYFEMKLLLVLSQGLKGSEIDWNSSADEQINVMSKVLALIEKVREEPNMFFASSPSFESVEAIVDSSVIVPRQNLDFTEILWQILKNCASETILINCLNVVYDALCSGAIQPKSNQKNDYFFMFHVHSGNVTPLARFIRDCYKEKLEKPTLDGSAPMRILYDIGVDKLTRDYLSIFADFKEIIHFNVEEFFRQQTSSKIYPLIKLHWCLQTLVLARSHLDLSITALRQLMKNAFERVKTGDVSPEELENYEFETFVSTLDIKNFVHNNYFRSIFSWNSSVWRLTLETNEEACDFCTSIVFDVRDKFLFTFDEILEGNLFATTIFRRSNRF